MIAALKKFISDPRVQDRAEDKDQSDVVESAAAALLVEAALADGSFDDTERTQIQDVLDHLFDLSENDIQTLIADAEQAVANSNQLYGFTRTVKDTLEYDRRVEMMQMLWEVVYADGQLDDFEANLVRRVSGLLYVTDQDSGRARKAALDQLGLDPQTLT